MKYGWLNFKNEIIESISENFADTRERFWIKFYNSFKNGLNSETGGNKNKHISKETKLKISESKRGTILSKEHKQKIRNSLKGIVRSKETKLKISKANKGKIRTVAQRIKMKNSHIGKIQTDETK